ncbi:MAG: hypothetical protein WCO91_10230, partial [Gemmataceae bacterium]
PLASISARSHWPRYPGVLRSRFRFSTLKGSFYQPKGKPWDYQAEIPVDSHWPRYPPVPIGPDTRVFSVPGFVFRP